MCETMCLPTALRQAARQAAAPPPGRPRSSSYSNPLDLLSSAATGVAADMAAHAHCATTHAAAIPRPLCSPSRYV